MIVTQDSATGRYRVTINGVIDGKRVRKTKLLPIGFSLEQAYGYVGRIYSGPLSLHDQLAKIIAGRSEDPGILYFIQNPSMQNLIKIGMTRRSVYERIKSMSTGHAYQWTIICHGLVKHAALLESSLHQYLAEYRESTNREFFRITTDAALELHAVCMEVDGTDLSDAINMIGRG